VRLKKEAARQEVFIVLCSLLTVHLYSSAQECDATKASSELLQLATKNSAINKKSACICIRSLLL
jgi:hypothetical protein